MNTSTFVKPVIVAIALTGAIGVAHAQTDEMKKKSQDNTANPPKFKNNTSTGAAKKGASGSASEMKKRSQDNTASPEFNERNATRADKSRPTDDMKKRSQDNTANPPK